MTAIRLSHRYQLHFNTSKSLALLYYSPVVSHRCVGVVWVWGGGEGGVWLVDFCLVYSWVGVLYFLPLQECAPMK